MITIDKYCRPDFPEAAWELNQGRGNAVLGGMLWLKNGSRHIRTAIDLSGHGLDQITEESGGWRIGAMVPLRELELHPGINAYTGGAVREALRHIVGVQFRNLDTVGGSIFARFGFSDVCTLFGALDCDVELVHAGVVPIRKFLASPRDRDILKSIFLRKTPLRCVYQSVRNSQTDFPVLACGAALVPSDEGPVLRLSIGGRPAKAMQWEQVLSGPVTAEQAREIGTQAAAAIPTGSNLRGSAAYRTHLIQVLATRAAETLGGDRT